MISRSYNYDEIKRMRDAIYTLEFGHEGGGGYSCSNRDEQMKIEHMKLIRMQRVEESLRSYILANTTPEELESAVARLFPADDGSTG